MHKNVCIQTVVTPLLPLVVIKVIAVINTRYLGQCRTGFLKGQKSATVVSHLTALTGKKKQLMKHSKTNMLQYFCGYEK